MNVNLFIIIVFFIAVMDAIEGARVAAGPCTILYYVLQVRFWLRGTGTVPYRISRIYRVSFILLARFGIYFGRFTTAYTSALRYRPRLLI